MPVADLRATVFLATALAVGACHEGTTAVRHREREPSRDRECKDASRPQAFFYPAENRTDYKPDDPHKDGCELLVPDHLFCCPPQSASERR